MKKDLVRKMCVAALLTAMGYVVTAFLPFAYPGGAGYFNFGDIFIFFGSAVLGPWYGAFIGMVAGSMADLTAGFANFALFTLLAKLIMAVVSGYLYKFLPKKIKSLAFIAGGILMACVYFVANWIFAGNIMAAWLPFGMDILQITVASIVAYVVILSVNEAYLKTHGESLFNS